MLHARDGVDRLLDLAAHLALHGLGRRARELGHDGEDGDLDVGHQVDREPAEREEPQRHEGQHHDRGHDGPADGEVGEEHDLCPLPAGDDHLVTRPQREAAAHDHLVAGRQAREHLHAARGRHARLHRALVGRGAVHHEDVRGAALEVPVEQRLARHLQHVGPLGDHDVALGESAAAQQPVGVRHLGNHLRGPAGLVEGGVDELDLAPERPAGRSVRGELEREPHLYLREARGRHRHGQVEQPVVDDPEGGRVAAHVLEPVADVDRAQRDHTVERRLEQRLGEARLERPHLRQGRRRRRFARLHGRLRLVVVLRRDQAVLLQLLRAIELALRARLGGAGLRDGRLERLDGRLGLGRVEPREQGALLHRDPLGDVDLGHGAGDLGLHVHPELGPEAADDLDALGQRGRRGRHDADGDRRALGRRAGGFRGGRVLAARPRARQGEDECGEYETGTRNHERRSPGDGRCSTPSSTSPRILGMSSSVTGSSWGWS